MEMQISLVKAFTKDNDKGNPAGVVLASDLSAEQMQGIASDAGFPATVFIEKTGDVYNARFFSTVKESPLCVHAVLAAVHVLVEKGCLDDNAVKLHTRAGNFPVTVYNDGLVFMEMPEPEYSDFVVDRREVAKILRIEESDFADHELQIVSAGKPKLLVPVKSLDKLLAVNPDLDGMRNYCRKSGARGFFLFTFDARTPDSDFYARHFNPLTLETEDPICGVGSGALGAYLQNNGLLSKPRFSVQMGQTMDTDGCVIVDATYKIRVGGYCTVFGEKTLRVKLSRS